MGWYRCVESGLSEDSRDSVNIDFLGSASQRRGGKSLSTIHVSSTVVKAWDIRILTNCGLMPQLFENARSSIKHHFRFLILGDLFLVLPAE